MDDTCEMPPVTEEESVIKKQCATCGKWKPHSNFVVKSKARPPCVRSKCNKCRAGPSMDKLRKARSKWDAACNGNRFGITRAGAKNIWSLYRITLDEYDDMDSRQGGVCAICLKPCRRFKRLSIDHDHKTGAVRGLLCQSCNAGIGNLRDDPEILAAAKAYLDKWRAKLNTCQLD